MRKKDREITDRREIERVLTGAKTMLLAINEAGAAPYVVPVNFGYRDGAVYFHSSPKGKKMELLARDPVVSFAAQTDVSIIAPEDRAAACEWSMAYRSVVGSGRAVPLTGPEEKRAGLRVLMHGVAPDIDPAEFKLPDEIVAITAVVRIDIEHMTGKKYRV